MAFDAEGLQDFIARGEKSPPPVFVGRKNVLADIEAVGGVMSNARGSDMHGVPGMTRIIHGAPGAGKSSVLAELVKRSAERDGAPGQARIVTFESNEILESLPDVIRTVSVAASLDQARWQRFLQRFLPRKLTLGPTGVSVDFTKAADGPAPGNLSDLARMYPRERWVAPVIVAVDEAQALPRSANDPHALFLRGIHNTVKGLPVGLVLAGLGDTRDTAHGMDLTRGTRIHEVGGLDAKESATLMRDFCRHFGMDPSGHEGCLDALAEPTEGWPRHLHFTMQALAEEALRREGDLVRVDWARVGNEAAESRTRYYSDQQSAEMEEADGLTATVMNQLKDGMKMSGVLRLIEENVRDRAGHRLPKGMDAEDFHTHLVHRGALQKRVDKTLHSPIPSFRSYLIHAGGVTARARPSELPEPSPFDDAADPFGT